MTRFMRFVLLLCVLGGVLAGAPATSGQDVSNAEPQQRARCERGDPDDVFAIDVLVLVDASSSLRGTDPDRLRIAGLDRTLIQLASIQALQDPSEVQIRVAVDGFSGGYFRHLDWASPRDAQQQMPGLRERIARLDRWTNYAAAVDGAADRFAERPNSDCRFLVWFTDGHHDTTVPGETTPEERIAIQNMCAVGGSIERITADLNLTTNAVILGSTDDIGSMRTLFGQGATNCPNPLTGTINSDYDATDIAGKLDEIVAEGVAGEICPTPLPGEPEDCDPPTPEEAQLCAPTADEPNACVYEFTITPDVDAFRVYVDKTDLHRGIQHPDEIFFVLESPDGETRSRRVRPGLSDTGWDPIDEFGFWVYPEFDSRLQIIAHRGALPTGLPWDGTWRIRFGGDTPAGEEDAQKVAASVRTVKDTGYTVQDFTVRDDGALVGYLTNEFTDGGTTVQYLSKDLYLRPEDRDGQQFYPARAGGKGYLDAEPVPLVDDDGLFEVLSLGRELVNWDAEFSPRTVENCSKIGGGKLWDEIADDGRVSLRAVIHTTFEYGKPGNEQDWVDVSGVVVDATDVARGGFDADEAELDDMVDRCGFVAFLSEFSDENLPDSIQAAVSGWDTSRAPSPPTGASVARVDVSVTGGGLPWTAELAELQYADGHTGNEPTSPNLGGAEAERPWECNNDTGDWRRPARSVDCAAAVVLWVTAPASFAVVPSVSVAFDDTHIENRIAEMGGREAFTDEQVSNINEALTHLNRQSVVLTARSDLYAVTVPKSRWPYFLMLASVLFIIGGACRFVRARRERRWVPLNSQEYVIEDISAGGVIEQRDEVSAALMSRRASAPLGPVSLRSGWVRPLLGRPRQIVAVPSAGNVVAASGGTRKLRKGAVVGIVGDSLGRGWCAVGVPNGVRLVVWDKPMDGGDSEAVWAARIESHRNEAIAALSAATEAAEPQSNADDVPTNTHITDQRSRSDKPDPFKE